MSTFPSYVLDGLSLDDNCLSLFVKWAFKKGEEEKYPNLVMIRKEIVKKCHGVPLAVRTLGSSLFSKFDLTKWIFVRDSKIWSLIQNNDDILPALKLSYDQMPSHLKHCFTYFSLYPKRFGFTSVQISKLWVALGSLQSQDRNQRPENITRDYIDELRSRSFLQDFEDFGHFYYFKVHDLVHDLALYVEKDDCVVVDSHTRNISQQVRNFSIVENGSLSSALFPKSRSVRTILFPIEGVGLDSEIILDTWVSRYKYLRVCKLQSLQVLSLTGCMNLETLPRGLGKLISLRQLYIATKQSVLSLNEFSNLSNLQTLSFEYCDNLVNVVLLEGQLASLETLIVRACGRLICLPLCNLSELEALLVIDCKNLELTLPYNLENSMKTWRMRFLHLENFPSLETSPELIERAAKTLQTLVLINIPMLWRLPKCFTRMTRLKMLHIGDCPSLHCLPMGMQGLTSLEDLTIDGCPELCQRCQPRSEVYWPLISHIKRVSIVDPEPHKEEESLFCNDDDILVNSRR